jgi:hippurate hydrolase
MLGSARREDEPQLHHPLYDFNDDLLPVGASYWATLAEQLLPRKGT